jgi:hypothetical protein
VRVPQVVSGSFLSDSEMMRLYLLDLPGTPARILALAFIAPKADFDRNMEAAAPIVDSLEFHSG